MILFDLKCSSGHVFEAWFHDSLSFDEQKEAGVIYCPLCDSNVIAKAPMAPRISGTGDRSGRPHPGETEEYGALQFQESESADDPGARPGIAKAPYALSGEYASFAEEVISKLSEIRDAVEKSCDYVGEKFPEEARKIHYGEAQERGIYGEATDEEAEDLADEGIEFTRLPIKPRKPHS